MSANLSTPGSTSASLLGRLKGRDPAGWERLVALYAPLVVGWCRRWRLQDADLADVVQEVFRAVAGGIDGFRARAGGGTFRGWLRVITRTKVQDHFRASIRGPRAAGGSSALRRLEQAPSPGAADDEMPDAAADLDERVTLVGRALEAIRAEFVVRTWEAFRRTAMDGQEIGAVAQDLGMSPGAVRVAKFRVLRRLRQELGDAEA